MKNNKGFTILELLVAMSIFVLIVGSSVGIFVYGLKIQRRSIAYQQLLDQTSYLLEYMSRAVRMSQKDISGACTGTAKSNYSFSLGCLRFRNYKGQCQQFCAASQRLRDENGNFLTSSNLSVQTFLVTLFGEGQNDNVQPRVNFYIDIRGREDARIITRTDVSQRNLDIKK